MAWRVIIANNKGGAGKTAITSALAAALAAKGLRVLCVDMDGQGNLTRRLGYDETTWGSLTTISDALKLRSDKPVDPKTVIAPCLWDHEIAGMIDLLPSRPPQLEQRGREAGKENGAEHRLRRVLDAVDTEYDITLIDVPPGLGHLTDLGLAAADRAVLILKPEFDFVQGAVRLGHYIDEERVALGRPELEVVGVIVTDVEQNATHRAQLENLPNLFPAELLWEPQVPHRATWSGANSDGLPVHILKGRIANELIEMFAAHADLLLAALNADNQEVSV